MVHPGIKKNEKGKKKGQKGLLSSLYFCLHHPFILARRKVFDGGRGGILSVPRRGLARDQSDGAPGEILKCP